MPILQDRGSELNWIKIWTSYEAKTVRKLMRSIFRAALQTIEFLYYYKSRNYINPFVYLGPHQTVQPDALPRDPVSAAPGKGIPWLRRESFGRQQEPPRSSGQHRARSLCAVWWYERGLHHCNLQTMSSSGTLFRVSLEIGGKQRSRIHFSVANMAKLSPYPKEGAN